MHEPDQIIVVKSHAVESRQTRRKGILEKRLLAPEQSLYQNIVLVHADAGAEVELHDIVNSESIVVLSGTFRVLLDNAEDTISRGDVAYFPPGSRHGLICTQGPGEFLAVFAPARATM